MEKESPTDSLLDLSTLSDLLASAPTVEHRRGTLLFRQGETASSLPVLLSGVVRIYVSGNTRRPATLYRLTPGAVCPVSLSALLHGRSLPAAAIAETDVQVRYVPGDVLSAWIARSPDLFSLLLNAVTGRFNDLVDTTRQLMFVSLDVRLAQLLDRWFSNNPDRMINLTHAAIADELGTSRVVVSRLLKRLERTGCIRLSRKAIVLNDAAALQAALAAADWWKETD